MNLFEYAFLRIIFGAVGAVIRFVLSLFTHISRLDCLMIGCVIGGAVNMFFPDSFPVSLGIGFAGGFVVWFLMKVCPVLYWIGGAVGSFVAAVLTAGVLHHDDTSAPGFYLSMGIAIAVLIGLHIVEYSLNRLEREGE